MRRLLRLDIGTVQQSLMENEDSLKSMRFAQEAQQTPEIIDFQREDKDEKGCP